MQHGDLKAHSQIDYSEEHTRTALNTKGFKIIHEGFKYSSESQNEK